MFLLCSIVQCYASTKLNWLSSQESLGYLYQFVANTFSISLLLFFIFKILFKLISFKNCLWKKELITYSYMFGMMRGAIFNLCFAYIRNLWKTWVFIPYLLQKCWVCSLYPLHFAVHQLTQNLLPYNDNYTLVYYSVFWKMGLGSAGCSDELSWIGWSWWGSHVKLQLTMDQLQAGPLILQQASQLFTWLSFQYTKSESRSTVSLCRLRFRSDTRIMLPHCYWQSWTQAWFRFQGCRNSFQGKTTEKCNNFCNILPSLSSLSCLQCTC